MNISILKKVFLMVMVLFYSANVFADKDNPEKITDIVVISGKTESLSGDISGSISVLDELFIEEHNIKDISSLSAFIPNLYYKNTTSGDLLVSRGISTIDTSLHGPMGLYIDDVAYPVSYMQNKNLFDVKQVEVLRGPQGTLYGRNSESGVVNIVTNKPGKKVKGNIFAQAGNYSSYEGGFSVSGPVYENKIFAGISALISKSNGYVENEITDNDKAADNYNRSVSGKLRWAPDELTDISFSFDYLDKDFGVSRLRFENGPDASDQFKVRSSESDDSNETMYGEALRFKKKISGMEFVSVTGRRFFEKDFIHDFDRTFKKLGYSDMDLENESISQEFRLTGGNQQKFTWITGLYTGKDSIDSVMELNHTLAAMAKKRTTDSEHISYAVFGQGSYNISNNLEVSFGLRAEKSHQDGNQTFKNISGSRNYNKKLSETEYLPKLSLMYFLSENLKAYATYSKGWLQGGYNYFSATSKDNFSYNPEYTDNYEAGIKTAFFDRRLNVDFAVFYADITDKQIREEVIGAGPGVWKFTNAAKVKTKGFEVDILALPASGLELRAGAGLAVSEIDEWSSGSADYSGNNLPWAPKFTYSLGAGYYLNNGLYFTGDISGCGKRYFDAANTLKDSGYALVGLKSGYRYKNYDVSIWCRNLFDEEYINKKVQNNKGFTMVEDGEPRTFGITISWRI